MAKQIGKIFVPLSMYDLAGMSLGVKITGCTCTIADLTSYADTSKKFVEVRDPSCPVHVEPAVEVEIKCWRCGVAYPPGDVFDVDGEWSCAACSFMIGAVSGE